MKTVGVSGASGFIGSHISAGLHRNGCRVIEFVRTPRSAEQRLFNIGPDGLAIGETSDLDLFVHCAWCLKGAPKAAAHANVASSAALVEKLSATRTPVIFISSMAAFPEARSFYGRSKLLVEELVLLNGGVVLRPGTVYATPNRGLVGAIERCIRKIHIAPLFSGSGTRLYVVSIGELVEVVCEVAEDASLSEGKVLSIVEQPALSLTSFYKRIAREADTFVACIPVPASLCIALLKLCERFGLYLPIRSDSILSITHANPAIPAASANTRCVSSKKE
jgi:nucleoside-diphosphate-sugar epimerase